MLLLGLCIFNPLSLMVSHFLESETLGKGRKEPLSRCSSHCLKYKHSLVNIGVCLQRFPYPSPRRISVPPSGPSYSYPHWPRCRMKRSEERRVGKECRTRNKRARERT